MSSGGRVSIPNNVRKMILNIKEINGNHTEEEIYLTLKECNMDPNETAQKLLYQDTFHEVKRKKDRRKENLGNKESAESRRRPGVPGRGSRGGRGNNSLRSVSNDGSGGRNALGKENGLNQVPEKGVGLSSLPTTQDAKDKEIAPATSALTAISNGSAAMVPGSSGIAQVVISSGENVGKNSEDIPAVRSTKLGNLPPDQVSAKEKASEQLAKGPSPQQVASSLTNSSDGHTLSSSPAVYFSASDPVLVPSHDSRVPNAVGAIKREVGRTPVEQVSHVSSGSTLTDASEIRASSMQGKISHKSVGGGKLQISDSAQLLSSATKPSTYIGRSQQVIVPQKVSPIKEWKPKPTNTNLVEGSEAASLSERPVAVKADIQPSDELVILDSERETSKLQKNLEEFHISNRHVIIPDHLHVPDAEKLGFSFGSFDASFGVHTGYTDSHESEMNPAARSETSESVEEMAVHSSSNQDASATTEEGDEHSQSPSLVPRNLSSHDGDSSSTLVPEFNESNKQETDLQPGTHQYPVIHTSPSYGFGFMPPMVGTQLAPFENSESQAREGSRLPSFIIQQPMDPAAYYAQFYRSSADSDGRVSPFHSPGATTKYAGNTEVLSSQTSQSAQENGSSVLSTGGPSPIATQPTGLMQSSLTVPQQQQHPLFRQPTGIPIPHYPPTYLPYGHYFPQFYMPPPAIHQFIGNGAFPQQSQAGSVYPAPPGAPAKYSLSQYKAGNNTGESTHVGSAGSYGQYGSPPTGYNPNSTSASTANDDLSANQLKEGNPHVMGQQNEGSAPWIFPQGRDVSNLQTSSFYNFPQGQVAFNPSQGGGGNFTTTNMYHHPAAVSSTAIHHPLQPNIPSAADSAGQAPTVYQQQQPHHAQNNWPSNY